MRKISLGIATLFVANSLFAQMYYSMSAGNYIEDFNDITSTIQWPNSMGAAGTSSAEWKGLALSGTSTVPDPLNITIPTTAFQTASATGGVQRGNGTLGPNGTIVLLSTGATDNTSSTAIELYLDFTGRIAGTLSFDWASVSNSTGDRNGSLRVYTSTDGINYTELTAAQVLNFTNNAFSSGAVLSVSLPVSFDNNANTRLRFYCQNGVGGSAGSRPKISIDNVSVTSIAATCITPPSITVQPTSQTVTSPFAATFTIAAAGGSLQWQYYNTVTNLWTDLTNTPPYSGVTSSTLTVNPTNPALSELEYRCVVKAAYPCSDLISNSAILTVISGPCISEGFNNGITAPGGWTFTGIASTYANAANSGAAPPSLTLDNTNDRVTTIPIGSGASELSFWIKGQGTDAFSALLVEGWNGLAWVTIDNIVNLPTTGTPKVYNASTLPLLPSGLFQFRFTYTKSVGNLAFDDVLVNCTPPPCVPTAIITSFSPSTGPAGTIVTINGSGFTGTTAVKFGTLNATSFTVVNNNQITAKVPANAPTDKINVAAGTCEAASSSSFTLIAASGCGNLGSSSTVNNISISEVYDAKVGTLSYIEIFNGTASAVNLVNYTIRVREGASTDNDYPLSGSLASGAVAIIRLGTSSPTCTIASPIIDLPAANGYNGNDQIFLLQNGNVIDYVPNPGYPNAASLPGFSQIRKAVTTAATIPGTIYTASDWVISTTETCNDLGMAPYAVGGSNITITAQPADVVCNSSITLSAAATTSPAGSPTYVWKYLDPSLGTWDNVSNLSASYSGVNTTPAGMSSVSITGATAILQNFQFYVEVKFGSSPQCIQSSNAAQYNYDSRKFYRSVVAAGNWSDKSIWEMSSDNATWVSTCNYPTSINSDEITISNGHTVTLDIDNAVDKLTISNTGKLISTASSQLTIQNGAANADFIINGIYEDGANAANSVAFATGATWQLGTSGTLIRTNTSGAAAYRDNYEQGMINIPETANWIVRGSSSINVPFTTATGTTGSFPSATYYPNLIFESSSGLWSPGPTVLSSRFAGSLSFATIKGNLDIGGTGAGTVRVYNENTNAQPLLVNGNLIVRANNTLTNAGNVAGTGFEVKGNITIDGTLDNNGLVSTGILKLSGNSSQIISGLPIGVMNLQDVTIANTGGAVATVNKSFGLAGVLRLSDGSNLNLNSGYVTLKSTATATAMLASINTGNVTYSGAGRFVVERFFPTHRAWRLMTAPVSTGPASTDHSFFNSYQAGGNNTAANAGNATYVSGPNPNLITNGLDVTPLNNASLKLYDAATGKFVDVTNTRTLKISGNTFAAGQPDNFGFFMFVRGDRFNNPNWVTPGVPVNSTTLRDTGKIQVQTYTYNATPTLNSYTLVGNPYASPVDFTKVLTNGSTTGVYNKFWSWDPNLNSVGAYVLFDGGAGYSPVKVPVTAIGAIGQTKIIQSKQAVFVQTSNASSPKVVFREIDKDLSNNQAAYRPEELPTAPMLASNIYYFENKDKKVLLDGNMVQSAREFKNEVITEEDAAKLTNINENFGIKNGSHLLMLDKRTPFKENDTIFYTLSKTNRRKYQLQFIAERLVSDNLIAYLEDSYLKTSTPIKIAGETWVEFEVNAEAASADVNRFKIVFRKAAQIIKVDAYILNDDIAVEWSLQNESEIDYHVVERSTDGVHFDAIGKLNTKGNAIRNDYSLLDLNPAIGVYYFRIRSESKHGGIAYSDVVKVKMINTKIGIYIFPNPVTDNNIYLQMNNVEKGTYGIKLFNSSGQLLMQKQIVQPGGSVTHELKADQYLASGLYQLEVAAPGKKPMMIGLLVKAK